MLAVVAVALPLFLAVALLVVDGSRLYVEKRTLQNAADAIALAAAQDLPATGTCDTTAGCRTNVAATAQKYLSANSGFGVPGAITDCNNDPAATDCYQTPFGSTNVDKKIEVRLRASGISTFFGTVVSAFGGSASIFHPSARAAASKGVGTAAWCEVNGNPLPGWQPGDPCQEVTPGNHNSAYAGSTKSDAISISGAAKTFDTVQTNGCFGGGAVSISSANEVWTGRSGTCYPSTPVHVGPCGAPTFPCPTPAANSCDNSYVAPVTCGLGFPENAVSVRASIQSACDAQGHNLASMTYNQAWIDAHPPGAYCFGSSSLNFSISGTLDYNGYTFMAAGISVSNNGSGLSFEAPGGANAKNNPLMFVTGGLLGTGYCSSVNNNLSATQAITATGKLYDPCGILTFNSGGTTFTGFLEAFKISLTGAATHFIGTGPGGNDVVTPGTIHPATSGDLSLDE